MLTGLLIRATRALRTFAGSPLLWNSEFGSPLIRSILEGLIVFRWLLHVEEDKEGVYGHFKHFGRGKMKLLMLHLEDYIEKGEGDLEPLETIRDQLGMELNADSNEELQNIRLDGTFAKKNLRQMAEAVGMMREYRLLLSPTSSATHGEWPILDRHSLQRCLNPLHLFHRLPRSDLGEDLVPGLFRVAEGLVHRLLESYRGVFRPEEEATSNDNS